MTRSRGIVVTLGLLGATGVWFSASRAADEPMALSPTDQIAQLLVRIEKLEKRIGTLETAQEQATRQANAVYVPMAPRPQGIKPQEGANDSPPVEAARPRPRFMLLNGSPSAK